MKKREAFTLIELIAVLVILAILALIVTPLVLNIIRKARTAADKRSIDAYGRSIELAIADYLLDKGEFSTSIEQLQVEYTGAKVECTTTQLKDDGSVYLAECTVDGREVSGYTYGKGEEEQETNYTAYSVGDIIQYNGIQYYVIKDSAATETSVTLLKAEPLTVAEVNEYGAGHINRYTSSSQGTAFDKNGYGGMAYYSSDTCKSGNTSGCTSDYAQSEVKFAVDAWKESQAPAASEARLITMDELIENLGIEYYEEGTSSGYRKTEATPSWVYNKNYKYWTMSPTEDSASDVWGVSDDGSVNANDSYGLGVVRPVIILSKSEL